MQSGQALVRGRRSAWDLRDGARDFEKYSNDQEVEALRANAAILRSSPEMKGGVII